MEEQQVNELTPIEQPESAQPVRWKQKTAQFLAGQTLSLFGSALVQYAIIWHITLTTQSGVILTIATVSAFLPQIVISLFAGVWADRYNRKFLIIFSDLLTASSTLVLAILFLLGYDPLWLLFVVAGIRSVGAGIQTPAVGALLPQIVPTDRLMKVNGINGTIQPILFIISPVAAGAMMSVYRLESIFFVDVVTAAMAVTLMLLLKVPAHQKATSSQVTGYLDDLKAGIKYIRCHKTIRTLFGFNAVTSFLVSPAAFLTPLLVARSFGEEVWRLTANEVTFFVGMVLGGLLMTSWGGFKNRLRTIGLGCILVSVLFAGLGVVDLFPLYLVLMVLCGIPVPIMQVPTTTLMQEMVDADMQGRVFGVSQLIMTTAMPAGMLVFGPLADLVSVELLLIVTGALMAIPGVWLYLNQPTLKPDPCLNPAD